MKKSLIKESALFITGHQKNVKVKGQKERVKAYLDVLVASRDLYEALQQENITLNEIKILVEKKKDLSQKYKKKTNTDWPL